MTEARELLGRLGMDWNHEDCRALIKNFTEEMETTQLIFTKIFQILRPYMQKPEMTKSIFVAEAAIKFTVVPELIPFQSGMANRLPLMVD